jgi:hypothetical protein
LQKVVCILFLFDSGIVAYSEERHGRSTAMNSGSLPGPLVPSWIGRRA